MVSIWDLMGFIYNFSEFVFGCVNDEIFFLKCECVVEYEGLNNVMGNLFVLEMEM